MEIRDTGIEGLMVLEPRVFQDPRGYFFESYHRELMKNHGIDLDFYPGQSESLYPWGYTRIAFSK